MKGSADLYMIIRYICDHD